MRPSLGQFAGGRGPAKTVQNGQASLFWSLTFNSLSPSARSQFLTIIQAFRKEMAVVNMRVIRVEHRDAMQDLPQPIYMPHTTREILATFFRTRAPT